MRLDPRNRDNYLLGVGVAYRAMWRCEEAITALKKFVTRHPNHGPTHVNLAACYAEVGKMEEAQAEIATVKKLYPDLFLEEARQRWPYKNPGDLERLLAALRKAGLK